MSDSRLKYTDDLPSKMMEFFDIENSYDKIVIKEIHKISASGNRTDQVEYKLIPKKLPTFERFAHNNGLDYSTIRKWVNKLENPEDPDSDYKYPELIEAYNRCKYLQKDFLIQNGLAGMYPPASYIFTAKNITDMTDKQIIETEDKQFKEKKDALSTWFNTIRHHVKPGPRDSGPNTDSSPGI